MLTPDRLEGLLKDGVLQLPTPSKYLLERLHVRPAAALHRLAPRGERQGVVNWLERAHDAGSTVHATLEHGPVGSVGANAPFLDTNFTIITVQLLLSSKLLSRALSLNTSPLSVSEVLSDQYSPQLALIFRFILPPFQNSVLIFMVYALWKDMLSSLI